MNSTSSDYNPYSDVPMHYTERQIRVVAALYYVMPPFSLLGSTLILYCIYYGKLLQRTASCPVYIRLMLGFSAMDFIHTLGILILGPWSVVESAPHVLRAAGTVATCNANAFFVHMNSGLWMYCAYIAIYRTMTIRYQWPASWIAKYWEPAFHALAWGVPVLTGIVFILKERMNPIMGAPGSCWMSSVPSVCSDDEEDDHPPCVRGNGEYILMYSFMFWIYLHFAAYIVCFGLIYTHVRSIERKLARYDVMKHGSQASKLLMSSRVGRQSLRYIGAMALSTVFVVLSIHGPAFSEDSRNFYFVTAVAGYLTFPFKLFLYAAIFHSGITLFVQ